MPSHIWDLVGAKDLDEFRGLLYHDPKLRRSVQRLTFAVVFVAVILTLAGGTWALLTPFGGPVGGQLVASLALALMASFCAVALVPVVAPILLALFAIPLGVGLPLVRRYRRPARRPIRDATDLVDHMHIPEENPWFGH